MREIGSLSSEDHADRLVSYLQLQSIPSSAEEEGGQWIIWVQNDDDRERGRQLLKEFQESPDLPQYSQAVEAARKLSQAKEKEKEAVRKRQIDIRKRWSGAWWYSHPATQIITAICVLVVVICTDWQARERGGWLGLPQTCNAEESWLRNALFLQPPMVITFAGISISVPVSETLWETMKSGQVWRLVTPVFLHFSFLHILFNMMWLRYVGSSIEFVRGTRRFLALFFILAITSNLVQYYWDGPNFGGMSGVVFGLIGYTWMKGRTQPHLGLGLTPDQVVYSFLWLALCLGGAVGGVANGAHLGGFVVGILIGARQAIWKNILGRS